MRPTTRAVEDGPEVAIRAFGSRRRLKREEMLAAPLCRPRPSLTTRAVTEIPGIGVGTATALREELAIESVEDLLLHLPRDFEAAPPELPMDKLELGNEAVVVGIVGTIGRFQASGPARGRGRRPGRLEVTFSDTEGRGTLRAIWFNQPWVGESLRPGMRLRLTGTAEQRGFVVRIHEEVRAEAGSGRDEWVRASWRGEVEAPAEIHSRGPVPLHPASEKVPARRLRRLCWQALARAEHRLDALPARLRAERGLPTAADALRAAHFPALVAAGSAGLEAAETGRRRLALEELLLHQTVLVRRRRDRLNSLGSAFPQPGELSAQWRRRLPFRLTADQERAIDEIGDDLESGRPMRRLLMGEVGSGKTAVALAAMLRAVEAGGQAALMAPTEVLAEQHWAGINVLLKGTGLECGLLTGSTPGSERRRVLAAAADGELKLLIGTHALIEDGVSFLELLLTVVDEQHRFGVGQRAKLDQKAPGGHSSHMLHMSATPIPRTLALVGYGDLDLSVIRELPPGRQPIETRVVEPNRRRAEMAELRERLAQGRQAYVICPLVEESEALQARAAVSEAERLAADELAGFKVGVLHGRMNPRQKRAAMSAFADGEIDVLVATTVVEVGVDVANATTIVIEGAERFGLAQLHQLRGRVGRGRHASFCLLMPDRISARARQRLAALAAGRDGFELAELDLRLRGAGEILGRRQHGLPELRAARLPEDEDLLLEARREAENLDRAGAEQPGWELLANLAESRFGGVSEREIVA